MKFSLVPHLQFLRTFFLSPSKKTQLCSKNRLYYTKIPFAILTCYRWGPLSFVLAVIRVEKDFDLTVEWPPFGGYGHGSSFIFALVPRYWGIKEPKCQM